MMKRSEKALLPAGMSDRLPPESDWEDDATHQILACFKSFGYQRVKPPLLEFEDNLLSGNGLGLATETFRLMDPVSQRMMGLRADCTPQIARIATTRLAKQARPVRLSYSAEVLRVSSSQLRPERQFRQVGAELIGTRAPSADVEVILMALDALGSIGIGRISVDLSAPTLVKRIAEGCGLGDDLALQLREALDRKDAAEVQALTKALAPDIGALFTKLLDAVGPADRAMSILAALDVPDSAKPLLSDLRAVVEGVRKDCGDAVTLTVDPVDNRGFEYHAGVTFTLFAHGARGELANGGRYHTEADENGDWEACTGLTVFMDTVLRALPEPGAEKTILTDLGTPEPARRALRQEGWIVLSTLEPVADLPAEAEKLNCTHYLGESGPVAVG